MKTFVTFGQGHIHKIGNKVFDNNCVAIVNGDREEVFKIFGKKFCLEYPEQYWDDSNMKYYPRGYIEAN